MFPDTFSNLLLTNHPNVLRYNCQTTVSLMTCYSFRGADKSLSRPGRNQARKHVRDARDFNNIETRAVIKFLFSSQSKAPNEIHAILTEKLSCFLPVRAKDLSAHLVVCQKFRETLPVVFDLKYRQTDGQIYVISLRVVQRTHQTSIIQLKNRASSLPSGQMYKPYYILIRPLN